MKIALFRYTILAFLVSSAAIPSNAQQPAPSQQQTPTPLALAGKYEGMLPCADCAGLETELFLKADYTFQMRLTYRAKDTTAYPISGKYTLDAKTNTVHCIAPQGEWKYRIGEHKLTQLDKQGKEITGKLANRYVLTRKKAGFR